MKTILIVLDGAGDMPDSKGNTPLSTAKKPFMDKLVSLGQTGVLDIGYKGGNKDVNSDMGYMVILGCYDSSEYPGRGYVEALGTGLDPGPDDICIRGNFATLDSQGNIQDRRAGRDETGLDDLAEKINGMEIDGVEFVVRKSSGHRVSILMRGEGLSQDVIPNDMQKTGVPLPQLKPKTKEAKKTSAVLNKFVYRANRILSEDPVNKERKLPANTILIRNLGKAVKLKSFRETNDLKAFGVSGLAVTKGICSLLGIDNINVPGANGLPNTNLEGKADAVIENMGKYDLCFLHINGTDTLSHSRDPEGKKEFIEKIDKTVVSKLIEEFPPEENLYIITCDHRSASSPEYKDYEHLILPVPVLVVGPGIKPHVTKNNGAKTWSEKESEKGFSLSGNELIPWCMEKTKT